MDNIEEFLAEIGAWTFEHHLASGIFIASPIAAWYIIGFFIPVLCAIYCAKKGISTYNDKKEENTIIVWIKLLLFVVSYFVLVPSAYSIVGLYIGYLIYG